MNVGTKRKLSLRKGCISSNLNDSEDYFYPIFHFHLLEAGMLLSKGSTWQQKQWGLTTQDGGIDLILETGGKDIWLKSGWDTACVASLGREFPSLYIISLLKIEVEK